MCGSGQKVISFAEHGKVEFGRFCSFGLCPETGEIYRFEVSLQSKKLEGQLFRNKKNSQTDAVYKSKNGNILRFLYRD
jgi:hypothetical protein